MAKPREIMGASVPLAGHDVPWYATGETGITKDHVQEMTAEVPVWVNGLQRWVTGVDRKTTCDDVIKVLLRSDPSQQHPSWNGHHLQDDLHHRYAIVERWRKVERPLDGRSRILKVWSAWGDAQRDVKLALRRRVPGTASGGSSAFSGITKETMRRRRHHHHHHDIGRSMEMLTKTLHPKRLHSRREDSDRYHYDKEAPWIDDPEREGCEFAGTEPKFTDTMEKLMKLILAQGETIQTQLKKLREREDQIDHFEHEVHRLRVKNHGSNYLLDTYLKGVDAEGGEIEEEEGRDCEDGSKGEDSGVVTEGGSGDGSGDPPPPSENHGKQRLRVVGMSDKTVTMEPQHRDGKEGLTVKVTSDSGEPSASSAESPSSKDLQEHIELWEKILKVNKKLEKTEECLVKLHVKLRQHSREKSPARVPDASEEDEERLKKELEWTRAELEKAAVNSNGVDRELEKNEEALAHADEWLEVRHRVLKGLQMELDSVEKESEVLSRKKEELASSTLIREPPQYNQPPPVPQTKCMPQRPNREEIALTEKGVGVAVTTANTAPMRKMMEKDSHDTDSNSDTGLSSLHSSSEEGGYVLDTLV